MERLVGGRCNAEGSSFIIDIIACHTSRPTTPRMAMHIAAIYNESTGRTWLAKRPHMDISQSRTERS